MTEPGRAAGPDGPGRAFPRIGVLVVAYNAQTTIQKVLARIRPTTWDRLTEVFVFDDSSADDTAAVAHRYLAEGHLPYADKVRIFRNQVNLGYGGNQKRGYRYAEHRGLDVVVLLHGDGQYAPEVMDELIDRIVHDGADAVFGSRMMVPGAARRGGMPLYKYIGNKILTTFQNMLLGLRLTEYHSGYRAYRVAALRQLPLERNSNDFHFDNEIILQLHGAGLKIVEVPIPTYYGDEICYVNGMAYAGNVVKTTFRFLAHRFGLAHAAPFELKRPAHYSFKRDRYSSHRQLIDQVEAFSGGRPLRALDVGCGPGYLARELRTAGHHVVGVDAYPSSEAEKNCSRFIVSEIEHDLGLADDEQFDCVLLADVLEHLSNPEQLLLNVRRHLRPGGRIFASTGNVAHWFIRGSLLLGQFHYTERGILDRTHRRLFTRGTFRRLIEACGFRPSREGLTPIPFELVLPGWPRLAGLLSWLNMLVARAWPSLFAYQVMFEAGLESKATDLRRTLEIQRDYTEFQPQSLKQAA